jgi:SAM-dependent methyltransferase
MVWTPADVVDVDGPRAMLRAYLEQRDVRGLLASVCGPDRVEAACDVGCGFGRLTPVLSEFARHVVGCEREQSLLAIARPLHPAIEFRTIDSLAKLPAETRSFDIGLAFTVLQHVPEPEVRLVIDEIRRVLKPDGYLLMCEETDATLEAGDREQAQFGYTRGRPIDVYGEWLAPWTLLAVRRREIEPGYARPDVGNYMLFAGPEAVRS